jgi:hypothetical protein
MAAFIFDASGIIKRYLIEVGSGWVQGLASDRLEPGRPRDLPPIADLRVLLANSQSGAVTYQEPACPAAAINARQSCLVEAFDVAPPISRRLSSSVYP